MKTINIMLDDGAVMPTRAHKQDAGLDLFSCESANIIPGGSHTFNTGVHIQIPEGYVGLVLSKSGLCVKHGLTCHGVVDAGYTGSVIVKLFNHSGETYHVNHGDKVGQLVILPIVTPEPVLVDSFPETDRGSNGFGSTGR